MVQDTPTKLTLTEWARLAGVQPLQFWGVAIPQVQARNANTDDAWFQYAWQNLDSMSREELAGLIAQAEADIESYVHFNLLPAWTVDEWEVTQRPILRSQFNLNGRDIRGFSTDLQAKRGWFIRGGIRVAEVIENSATITYSNTMPPSTYDNQAEVQVTVPAGIDPQEVRVYYPGHGGEDKYEIRPVVVSINAITNIATVTFQRAQCVILDAFETYEVRNAQEGVLRPVDGTDDANFLEEVDVWRIYNDPSVQATLMWRPPLTCGCGAQGSCVNCTYATQEGCLIAADDPRSGRLGWQAAAWNAETESMDFRRLALARQPDTIRTYYLSGFRDQKLETPLLTMDGQWARTVAILAASRFRRPPVDRASRGFVEYWNMDLAYATGGEQISRFNIPQSTFRNPFGTHRGEIYAWNECIKAGVSVEPGVSMW